LAYLQVLILYINDTDLISQPYCSSCCKENTMKFALKMFSLL
jgi:hypothetical protein